MAYRLRTDQRRPELSQHFLRPWAANRIAGTVTLSRPMPVIEIGAGDGALTQALGDGGCRVIAIEKDARLYRALRSRFIGSTNVECHHADALTWPLPRAPYAIVANLPFGITSAVVRRLLSARTPPEQAWLVVQGEAAEKFAGRPRTTAFSLLHAPWFALDVPMRLSRDAFEPRPRVSAALLHVARRTQPLLTRAEAPDYRAFVRSTFGARDMRSALHGRATRRQVARLAREIGFSPWAPPPELTFDQWLRVFRSLHALFLRVRVAEERPHSSGRHA